MQTAVEWLECELKKIPFTDPIKAFKQAKQMEKDKRFTEEDVRKAFREGLSYTTHKTYHSFSEDSYISSIINNNETYGSKGSDETPMLTRLKEHLSNITTEQFNNEIDEIHKDLGITSSQTEISDKEIEKFIQEQNIVGDEMIGVYIGIKWYREQLKKKQ